MPCGGIHRHQEITSGNTWGVFTRAHPRINPCHWGMRLIPHPPAMSTPGSLQLFCVFSPVFPATMEQDIAPSAPPRLPFQPRPRGREFDAPGHDLPAPPLRKFGFLVSIFYDQRVFMLIWVGVGLGLLVCLIVLFGDRKGDNHFRACKAYIQNSRARTLA